MLKGYCKDDFKFLGMVILNAIYRVINVYFLLNKKIIMCLITYCGHRLTKLTTY